ncbi:MAG: VOC family protein [Haloarculaceae archaeon]
MADAHVLDHAVIAGSDTGALCSAFAGIGLDPEYGGEHDNGVTHNYTLGFPDGSYLELISTVEPGAESPWWNDPIHGDAGPCAWALDVADVEAEAERIAGLGIPVEGPTSHTRERPDGATVEFDLAVPGDLGMGAKYPMLIHDRTPRSRRIAVAESVADTDLTGVREVVLAVPDVASEAETFAGLFDCEVPEPTAVPEFGARLARFDGAPVTLAEPKVGDDGGSSWLRDRLDRFGPLPCAYLLGSEAPDATAERFDLPAPSAWGTAEVRWFDLPLAGRLGVLC